MHVRSVEAIERDAWLYIASEISYRTTPAQQQLCPNRPSTAILTTSVGTTTVGASGVHQVAKIAYAY